MWPPAGRADERPPRRPCVVPVTVALPDRASRRASRPGTTTASRSVPPRSIRRSRRSRRSGRSRRSTPQPVGRGRIRGCQAFRRQGGCAFKPFGGLLLDWAGLLVRSTSTETGLCPLGISSWPRAAQEGESEAPSIACTGCLRNPCRPSKCAPVGAWEFVVVGRSSGCGGESVRRPAVRPRARRGSVPSRTPLPGTT